MLAQTSLAGRSLLCARNPRGLRWIGCAVWTIAVLLLAGAALADEPGAGLDNELRENLESELMDDFDRDLFGLDEDVAKPGKQPPGAQPKPDDAPSAILEQLRQELGSAAESEDGHPMLEVARQMRSAQGLLGQGESGEPTQVLQGRILADLDALIRQAKKGCKSASPKPGNPSQPPSRQQVSQPQQKPAGGGKKPSDRPATESSQRPEGSGGEPREVDVAAVQELMKRLWGELPPKAREQMVESMVEDFLPRYEWMIEEYFRRLAEERSLP